VRGTIIPGDYSKSLRRKLADGKTLDNALAELRADGASIIECIGAVKKIRGCELGEAKKIVNLSPAWADVTEPITRELEELAKKFTNVSKQRAEDGSLYHCPCCGCRTLTERGGFNLCPVCFWEDDGQDDHDADEIRGGPNACLSLTEGRNNYRQFVACEQRFMSKVRKPLLGEI